MDPDSARQLAEQGGTLLLLDVPLNTHVGIDQQMFVAGPKFNGFKMIPPGTHFVYYCAASKEGSDVAPIIGFFVHLQSAQVVVRQWSLHEERLLPLEDSEQTARLVLAVRKFEFDAYLGPYNIHNMKAWQRLASYITPSVIERHEPVGGDVSVTAEGEIAELLPPTGAEKRLKEHLMEMRKKWMPQNSSPADAPPPDGAPPTASSSSSASRSDINVPATSLLPGSTPLGSIAERMEGEVDGGMGRGETTTTLESPETIEIPKDLDMDRGDLLNEGSLRDKDKKKKIGRCFYTEVPRLVKLKGMSATELTALNMDKTEVLEKFLLEQYGGREEALLGELQFAFVAFLMGQSLESFSQWKSIIHLMGGCYEAPLRTRTKLFIKWLRVLRAQLLYGLRADRRPGESNGNLDALAASAWLADDNFLRALFSDWFSMLREARQLDADLAEQSKRLKSLLEDAAGWAFADGGHDEDDEYAPVVVYGTEAVPMQNDLAEDG